MAVTSSITLFSGENLIAFEIKFNKIFLTICLSKLADGKRHRTDGPAYEGANGYKEWFVDGKELTEKQFNALTAPTLELTLEDIAAKFGVDVSKVKIVK